MFLKNAVQYLIVGLGNPGKKYSATLHNAGFFALDHIAAKLGTDIKKAKFDALYGLAELDGVKLMLLKPQTYMNLSGASVRAAADYYKIPPQNIVIIYDDVSLLPGTIRVRRQGSAGGHNGVKSVIAHIGDDFPRIKIGVGGKRNEQMDMADHVLSTFTESDRKAVQSRFDDIAAAVALILKGNVEAAMNGANALGKAPDDKT